MSRLPILAKVAFMLLACYVFVISITEQSITGHTLYFQFGRSRSVGARELYLCPDTYLSCCSGRADKYRSTTPFYSTGISIDGGVTDDATLTLDGKTDILLSQTANMAKVIGYFADDDDEVTAVGNELSAHLIGT